MTSPGPVSYTHLEDRTQKDLYIELIDFDTPENNIFKAVNQFEIEGVNNQLRIPDGIVFVNGIPVVDVYKRQGFKDAFSTISNPLSLVPTVVDTA